MRFLRAKHRVARIPGFRVMERWCAPARNACCVNTPGSTSAPPTCADFPPLPTELMVTVSGYSGTGCALTFEDAGAPGDAYLRDANVWTNGSYRLTFHNVHPVFGTSSSYILSESQSGELTMAGPSPMTQGTGQVQLQNFLGDMPVPVTCADGSGSWHYSGSPICSGNARLLLVPTSCAYTVPCDYKRVLSQGDCVISVSRPAWTELLASMYTFGSCDLLENGVDITTVTQISTKTQILKQIVATIGCTTARGCFDSSLVGLVIELNFWTVVQSTRVFELDVGGTPYTGRLIRACYYRNFGFDIGSPECGYLNYDTLIPTNVYEPTAVLVPSGGLWTSSNPLPNSAGATIEIAA